MLSLLSLKRGLFGLCRDTTSSLLSSAVTDYVDPNTLYYDNIYEVEVWLKYKNHRKKLDLVAKCWPDITREKSKANHQKQQGQDSDKPAAFEVGDTEDKENNKPSSEEPKLTAVEERLFEADRDYKVRGQSLRQSIF